MVAFVWLQSDSNVLIFGVWEQQACFFGKLLRAIGSCFVVRCVRWIDETFCWCAAAVGRSAAVALLWYAMYC